VTVQSWIQWFPRDFLASLAVQRMTTRQIGAYLLLLWWSWLNSEEPCHLPADESGLRELAKENEAEWKEDRKKVLAKFETSDHGTIYNERLLACYQEQDRRHAKCVAAVNKRKDRQDKPNEPRPGAPDSTPADGTIPEQRSSNESAIAAKGHRAGNLGGAESDELQTPRPEDKSQKSAPPLNAPGGATDAAGGVSSAAANAGSDGRMQSSPAPGKAEGAALDPLSPPPRSTKPEKSATEMFQIEIQKPFWLSAMNRDAWDKAIALFAGASHKIPPPGSENEAGWRTSFRLLAVIDKKPLTEILEVLDWAMQDTGDGNWPGWKGVCRSMPNFRDKWPKIATSMNAAKRVSKPKSTRPSIAGTGDLPF